MPIVPVAIMGTADVLPKGGRYSPAPMRVHIGAPVDPHDTSALQLRAAVMALRGEVELGTEDRYALADLAA